MVEDNVLEFLRPDLVNLVARNENHLPDFQPLAISPWLAMSVLQKATRRGHVELALRSAATLLQNSPDRFWRRICVIAFEDIGLAHTETVTLVILSLAGKRWRSRNGSEWAFASTIVSRMCRAPKCRAAVHLALVCDWLPALRPNRQDLAPRPLSELVDRIENSQSVLEQALALWLAIGTDRCASDALPKRNGDPEWSFECLRSMGVPECLLAICWEGQKRSREIMPAFLALLWTRIDLESCSIVPDQLVPDEFIDGIPCWAFDMHVREGNRALARFLDTNSQTSRWLRDRVPANERRGVLGGLLFSIEGGLVDRRMRWPLGDELARSFDHECHQMDEADAITALTLLRQDLPVLNEIRRAVVRSTASGSL